MSEPSYHHQDDVVGFCGDYRHPWGCQDDPEPDEQTDGRLVGMVDDEKIASLIERNERLKETLMVARDMLLELRSEVDQVERPYRFYALMKQRRWRLKSSHA